jgi:hypothetical protein
MPAARLTGPEIAAREPSARGCCERARPRRNEWPRPMPGARECLRAVRAGRQPPSEHADVAPCRKRARRRCASTSVCVIHGVRISYGGACRARDRRRNELLVDAGAGECASRARLPGVRRSAAGADPHGSQGLTRVANFPAGPSVSTTTTAAKQPLHAHESDRDPIFRIRRHSCTQAATEIRSTVDFIF